MAKFVRLPRRVTVDLPTAGTRNSGGIVYDTTTSTVKYSDGTSWANVAGAAANHAMLSSSHSDSTAAAVARGSIITGQGASPAWVKLTVGSAGTVLSSNGTDVSWAALAVGSITLATGSMILGASSVGSALSVKSDGYIIVGNGTTATSVAVSGDITLSNLGVVGITSLAIVNGDINATAGITVGKLAVTTGSVILGAASVGAALDAKGDGKIIVGNGTTATSVSVSGDCTLANDGAMTVTDLTISSEAAGDILYRNATNWVRLAKPGSSGYYLEGGVTPAWSLPSLASASSIQTGATLLDAGALDATITFTQQTAAGASVVIPDFTTGAAFTFGFLSKAQSWTAIQKFNGSCLAIGDTDHSHHLTLKWNANMAADQTLNIVTGAADRTITLGANITATSAITTTTALVVDTGAVTLSGNAAGSAITLPATGTMAVVDGALGNCTVTTVNKLTLTAPANASTITIADGKTLTVSRTIQFTSAGDNGVITLPNAAATLVATSDNLSVFAATTSAQLAGIISNETGSGLLVFGTAPTLTTPTINGVIKAYVAKSADYTMTAADYCVDVSGAAGAVTIALPTASGITGTVYVIKNSDAAQTVTINPSGAETVDGAGTLAMATQYQVRTVISDGTNWKVIGN